MSDLATTDPAAALELAADPGEFVVQCLERGKTWLAEALAHGDLDALVNMKGYAATLRVATMQKQLGRDAELAATELVRRAERCIGLGIRQGQASGDIVEVSQHADGDRVSIRSIVGRGEWSGNVASGKPGIRDLTDDISDEGFERAIICARDDGNMSRTNVVRNAKPERTKPKPAERHEIHRRAPRVNAERIIDESISMLEGIASGLALIEDVPSLDADKRLDWIEALRQPLAAINRFNKELTR